MSERESYDGRTSAGVRWGCALAAIIGLPVFGALLVLDALGDCLPGATCHKGFASFVLLPTLAVMLLVGLPVRWLVDRLGRRD